MARYERAEEVGNCQILFVAVAFAEIEPWLSRWRERQILVVGQGAEFAPQGGMIGFVTADRRILLAVNLDATRAAGLVIRSQLLRTVQLVGGEKEAL